MRRLITATTLTALGLTTWPLAGCSSGGDSRGAPPTPQRSQVIVTQAQPEPGPKPLPPPAREDTVPPPPYYDPPLVNQHTPEEQAFVNAYNGVGRPKILVFVNRTLEGQLLPVNADAPVAGVERRITSNGPVTVDDRTTRTDGYYRDRTRDASTHVQTNGPADFRESTEVYLHPGQYDEVQARSLDYEAVENVLTDWISADNHVTVVSPTLARQRLTDQQVKDLQSGRPQVGREVAQQLDAHILIQVQAHPTRQTAAGLEVRMIAEAIDVKHDGASLARAFVDVPPPLEKTQINKYTRFLARKLMDGMIMSWQNAGGPPPQAGQPGAGPLQPQPVQPAPSQLQPPPVQPQLPPPTPPQNNTAPAPDVTPPAPAPAPNSSTAPSTGQQTHPIAPTDIIVPSPAPAPNDGK